MSLKGRAVTLTIESAIRTVSAAGRLHPEARRQKKGIEVTRNVPYSDTGLPAHTLDIYRPATEGPWPVMLYMHGGGFSILSKDTHWMFGYGYAQRGFLVFNVNYRLAPKDPYPAALEDVSEALGWVLDNAEAHGGDTSRLVYAGESAGANLSLALAIAGAWPRPEAFAARVFERDPRPRVVLPACGLLQVSDADRYLSREDLAAFVRARIATICRGYLPDQDGDPDNFALADPLRFLESAPPPERPWPAIFAACGDADPVAEDTRRLEPALSRFEQPSRVRFYEGAGHAFHAMIWKPAAVECWSDHLEFIDAHL